MSEDDFCEGCGVPDASRHFAGNTCPTGVHCSHGLGEFNVRQAATHASLLRSQFISGFLDQYGYTMPADVQAAARASFNALTDLCIEIDLEAERRYVPGNDD